MTASLFVPRRTRDGRLIWKNSGISTTSRRGRGVMQKDAEALAAEHGVELMEGFGSLHNKPVEGCGSPRPPVEGYL